MRAVFLLLLTACAPPDAPGSQACDRLTDAAYVRGGAPDEPWHWTPRDTCIPLWVDDADPARAARTTAALEAAIGTWNQGANNCGVPVCLGLAEDGYPVVFVDDPEDWTHPVDDVAAVAMIQSTGRIESFSIELNGAHFAFTDAPRRERSAFDLESVLLHELGHVLGFDHSPHLESALRRVQAGERRRSLGRDDVTGLCEAYACWAPSTDGPRTVHGQSAQAETQ